MSNRPLPPSLVDALSEIDLRESDPAVRARRLEELIAQHPEHAAALRAVATQPAHPATLGTFEIQTLLGEGGFGRVYRARQTDGVNRIVALKVLRNDLDSRAVLARFELERQVLASMNHDAIARFYEAGQEDGRLWFSMEFVDGRPLTAYCDDHRLTIPARLHLLLQVCDAVQHAHGKGIVHRDLKPANVLVSRGERGHAAKIIDFGIARATDRQLSQSMQTVLGMVLGTPEYMAPEQCGGDPIHIDARTDVYALGVMLYEVISGQLPFATSELPRNDLLTVQRVLLHKDPPKPSTRILALGAEGHALAKKRQLSPTTWIRVVRGDLDAIVGRAMEKDPSRRYQSVADLAADLRRNLFHEPIVARPPSGAYRMKKFVRRYRGQVAAGAAVFTTALVGLVASLAFAVAEKERAEENSKLALANGELAAKAEAEAERARAASIRESERATQLEAVAKFQESQLRGINVEWMGTRFRTALLDALNAESRQKAEQILPQVNFTTLALHALEDNVFSRARTTIERDFSADPLLKARLLASVASTMLDLGLVDESASPLNTALQIRRERLGEDHVDTLASRMTSGRLLLAQGRATDASLVFDTLVDEYSRVLGPAHTDTLTAIGNLGVARLEQGETAEAEIHYRKALEASVEHLGRDHPKTLTARNNMGYFLAKQGNYADAEVLLRDSLEDHRKVLGESDPDTLLSLNNYAGMLLLMGRPRDAAREFRQALPQIEAMWGEEHPRTLEATGNLGIALLELGEFAEAEQYVRRDFERSKRTRGAEHPTTIRAMLNLGACLRDTQRFDEAEPFLRGAKELSERVHGKDSDQALTATSGLAGLAYRMGQLTEAESLFREVLSARRQLQGPKHPDALDDLNNLAGTLWVLGKFAEAEPLMREVLAISREVLPPDSATLFLAVDNVGRMAQHNGNLSEAEELYREALAGRRRVLGDEHPATQVSIGCLARVLRRLGKQAEAEPLFRELLTDKREQLGLDHLETLQTALELSRVLEGDERLELLGEFAAWESRSVAPAGEIWVARLLLETGRAFAELPAKKQFAEAERKLLAASERFAALTTPSPRDAHACALALVTLYEAWHAADPAGDHAAAAATWRTRAEEMKPAKDPEQPR